jgi:hypothetical protein
MVVACHKGNVTMPVTARLSQKFYERLGEDLAQELVDWFNAVDATYRADLRELNELNFQRFDAKLEASVAALREEIRTGLADRHVSVLKWMFGFWIATLVPLAGLILALQSV